MARCDPSTSQSNVRTAGPRLDSLTGLRFVAAFWVVLTHATVYRTDPLGMIDLGDGPGRVAELGYLGVTFFFVLSGFVLTWATGGEPIRAGGFYRRRAARVYPLHLATTLVAGAAILLTGGAVAAVQWPLCLLLVQAWVPDIRIYFALNGPSWSLACEAFFYLLTPLLLGWAGRRSTRHCVAAAAGVCLVMVLTSVVVLTWAPSRDEDVWSSPWFSLGTFTAGMALAVVLRRGVTQWPSLSVAWVGAALTLMILVAVSWDGPVHRTAATLVVLPAVVALIGAAALHDLRGGKGWLRHRWMVQMGEWSFALYLTHRMVLTVLHRYLAGAVTQHLGSAATPVLVVVTLAAVLCVSAAAHHWFEKPLESRLRPARACSAARHRGSPRNRNGRRPI